MDALIEQTLVLISGLIILFVESLIREFRVQDSERPLWQRLLLPLG